MNSKRYNVVVLPGTNRNGRGVALALKDGPFNLISVSPENKQTEKNLHKKYLNKYYSAFYYFKNNFSASPEQYKDEIIELLKLTEADFLIPTGTENTIAAAVFHDIFSKYCHVLTEPWSKMEQVHDKYQTMLLAEKLNIPHPKTLCPQNMDEVEVNAKLIGFPLVLKSRRGMSSTAVYIIHDMDELLLEYKKMISKEANSSGDGRVFDNTYPILQEYIPDKQLHDGTAFCKDGNALLVTSQTRLVTFPLALGGGIVNTTTFCPEIHEAMRKIVSKINWNYVLEADFIYDSKDSQYKLIEINPKFWGTNFLTTAAGYNYPLLSIQSHLNDEIDLPGQYQVGLTCRWLGIELRSLISDPLTPLIFIQRAAGILKRFAIRPQICDSTWIMDIPPEKILTKMMSFFQ